MPVDMFQFAKPGPYITQLSSNGEQQFQNWVKTNNIPFDPSPTSDYDMRGYWKATNGALPSHFSTFTNSYHFPDTYKTPYHAGFSNESIYANPNYSPHWEGDLLIHPNGSLIKNEVGKTPGTSPIFNPQEQPLNLVQKLLLTMMGR